MPEPWSTPESTCHAWTQALGLLEATSRLVPCQADFLRVPDLGDSFMAASRTGGPGPVVPPRRSTSASDRSNNRHR
jgi:hypothetical protein